MCYTALIYEHDLFPLECCGHAYCIECIKIQVTSPTTAFPLLCAAEGCSQPLVMQDINLLCKTIIDYSMKKLGLVSLRTFSYTNPGTIKSCLTPDCDMIHVTSEEGEKVYLQCLQHFFMYFMPRTVPLWTNMYYV